MNNESNKDNKQSKTTPIDAGPFRDTFENILLAGNSITLEEDYHAGFSKLKTDIADLMLSMMEALDLQVAIYDALLKSPAEIEVKEVPSKPFNPNSCAIFCGTCSYSECRFYPQEDEELPDGRYA